MKREFSVAITTNKSTGDLMAVYFQIRRGKATKVREFAEGNAFANYNASGELLGVEFLAPCEITVLDQIIKKDRVVRRFIESSAPRHMLIGECAP